MKDLRVAKRYADALFNVATAGDVVASVEDDLKLISGLLETDKSFRDFLYSPYASRDAKKKTVDTIFSDRVTALSSSLLKLLLEKRRETEIEGIYSAFVDLRRGADRTVLVTITSSEPLDDQLKAAAIAKAATLSGQKVEPNFIVEPRVIGGLRIAFENTVYDGTVQGNLDKLRDRLQTNAPSS